MKKKIAFIFTKGPHGYSNGREGLDILIATAVLTDNIGVFFISDGILLLLSNQDPKQILSRNFISTFILLPKIYDIKNLYICSKSAIERGFNKNSKFILNTEWLSPVDWRTRLEDFNSILTF